MERENDFHMDRYLRKHLQRRPLLRRVLKGGHLNPSLTLGRAVVGSSNI